MRRALTRRHKRRELYHELERSCSP